MKPQSGTRAPRALALGAAMVALALPVFVQPQPLIRKATTITALLSYPVFYHGERIIVRGELMTEQGLVWLSRGELRVLCLGVSLPASGRPFVEVSGAFWDVGRFEEGDPRLVPHGLTALSERLLKKPWPGIGELPVLAAETATEAGPLPAPTVRALALQPERYDDQRVTVVGRFRGRNLYGDLPQPPGRSRWDFVLQSADAAIWVTGLEPRGRGFRLDPDARVDTGQWLEVSGLVRHERGLVWIEAAALKLAHAPADVAGVAVAVPPPRGPSPEVIFSAPTQGDTEVRRDASVRIQFSRDMDPASFEGRVRVGYLQTKSGEEAEPEAPPVAIEYRDGNRVLVIRFTRPLDPSRTLKVELLPGIAAVDGASMVEPWSLTFAVEG